MSNSLVLEEFYSEIECPQCKMIIEHHVQKIDEKGDGQFIAYYAECNVCEHIEDYSIEYFETLLEGVK